MWNEQLERSIIADRSAIVQFGYVALGVGAAAGIRWFLDRGENGVEFATFYPVVVLSAVFLRWPFAVLAAVLSLIVGAMLFMDGLPLSPDRSRFVVLLILCMTWGLIIAIGQAFRWQMREAIRQ